MHSKFGLYRSVEAILLKMAVFNCRNHRIKPPIHGRTWSYRTTSVRELVALSSAASLTIIYNSEGGSTVHQTWFAAAASLTLPNLQLSVISIVEWRQTVADLGGVRGVQMHPPLAASNVFCVHNCTSPSNDYAAVACSNNIQAQLHTHISVPY